MELTSRGNIQIRGIRDDEAAGALADAVAAAGSAAVADARAGAQHRRLTAVGHGVGGHADVRDWVHRLDAAIRAEPALAELPGRFWFSIDDGRGDVSGLGADVGAHVSRRFRRRCCWPAATPACGSHRRTSCPP